VEEKFDTPIERRSALAQFGQPAPGRDEPLAGADRPVDEIQIDVVGTEAVQARRRRVFDVLAAVIVARVEILRRDVDRLLERAHRVSDLGLVAVRRGGIDVAIARRQCCRHDLLGFGFIDEKDA
jgi:hypothetical protein